MRSKIDNFLDEIKVAGQPRINGKYTKHIGRENGDPVFKCAENLVTIQFNQNIQCWEVWQGEHQKLFTSGNKYLMGKQKWKSSNNKTISLIITGLNFQKKEKQQLIFDLQKELSTVLVFISITFFLNICLLQHK